MRRSEVLRSRVNNSEWHLQVTDEAEASLLYSIQNKEELLDAYERLYLIWNDSTSYYGHGHK